MVKTISWIIALPVALIIFIPITLWFAFAATILWGWFIAPVFNVPHLTLAQMWGICLTLSIMRPRPVFTKKDERPYEWGTICRTIVFVPAIAIGIGYVIKFWIMPS